LDNERLSRENTITNTHNYNIINQNQYLYKKLDENEHWNKLSSSKLFAQEKDLNTLYKTLDDKNKTYGNLKSQLEQKINDAEELATEKRRIFNELEAYKYETHQKMISMQTQFNIRETESEQKANMLNAKANRLDEELEKTRMEYKMYVAEQKLSFENQLADVNKNLSTIIIENENTAFEKQQHLESKVANLTHENNEIKNNNSILIGEKDLLKNEVNLYDTKLTEATNYINALENSVETERKLKEECEKTNYLLKKSEIDLNEKNDLLEREKTNLTN
jgi:hypothetical protein